MKTDREKQLAKKLRENLKRRKEINKKNENDKKMIKTSSILFIILLLTSCTMIKKHGYLCMKHI